MTIKEAIENALQMLSAHGIMGGDVYDDLALALKVLRQKYPAVAKEEL